MKFKKVPQVVYLLALWDIYCHFGVKNGIVGLLGDSQTIAIIAVLVLIVGIVAGFGCISAMQKKYNKGLF